MTFFFCLNEKNTQPSGELKAFAQLIDEENAQIQAGNDLVEGMGFDRVIANPGSAEEPWVAFTNRDRVGLALSGGGIRSATFNLGLLQSLRHKGLLEFVDYLSTVSGGGYIGGFWTAWLQHSAELDSNGRPLIFPKQTQTNTTGGANNANHPSIRRFANVPKSGICGSSVDF